MKKRRINLFKILFLLFFTANTVFADDFVLPDWSYYSYREKHSVQENADEIVYEKVRKEQDFSEFFDRQKIIIHKNYKNLSPEQAGYCYLSRAMFCDKRAEKYILKADENDFIACYCSHDKKKCEIVRFYNGFDGLVEVRYTHNNLWHFQNNIGSFISTQMRIEHLPFEFTIHKLARLNKFIRL